MFAVFNLGAFIGFWCNKKEDDWATNTILKLKLQDPLIGWYDIPFVKEPEHFRFDESKNLIVQAKNEAGEIVDTEEIYIAESCSY